MRIAELTITDLEEIKELFRAVFTAPPWNEDWCGGTEYFIEEFCIRNECQKMGFQELPELTSFVKET